MYQPKEHFSISSLIRASGCLRKFFYSGLGMTGETTSALEFGKIMHVCIPLARERGIEEAMEKFEELWTGPESEDDPDWDKKRNPERARAMLEDFIDSKRNSEYVLVEPPGEVKSSDPEVSEWELEFYVEFGMSRPLLVRLDGLARSTVTQEVFVVEYKTSGEISRRYFDCYSVHPQPIGYVAALRSLGIETAGTLLDVLRVSPSNCENALTPIYVSSWQERAFWDWARMQAALVEGSELTGSWPQNFACCSPMGAHSQAGFRCDYVDLCHSTSDWRNLAGIMEKETEHE
jgi:hypothetical protein